ncbi:hypothetical protein ACSQ67_007241 [Phaseolus vulgaris]
MDFLLLGPMRNGGTILRGLLLDALGLLPLRAMVIDSSFFCNCINPDNRNPFACGSGLVQPDRVIDLASFTF